MDCKRIQELLSAYLDGALGKAEKESVEEHLLRCTHCRSEKERLERAVSLVRSLKEVDPPAGFVSSVRRRLEPESVLRRWGRKVIFPLPIKIPLEALATIFIVAIIIIVSRPDRRPMELARQERLTRPEEKKEIMDQMGRIDTIGEGRQEIAQAESRPRPAQLDKLAKGAEVAELEEEESLEFQAKVAEKERAQAPASVVAEHLAQRRLSLGRLERDEEKMLQKKAEISASQVGIPAPITDNYQVQVATDNVPVGLVKAQRIIYQNKGNMIRPSDESLATQIASKDIKNAELLFELPSYNYDQTLTQLKEIGKIIFIIPPERGRERKDLKKEKAYKPKYSVREKKPAIINIQLELTQSENE